VERAEDLVKELERAIADPGPHLIEVVIPTVFSARQLRAMPYALSALGKLPRPMASALKRRLYP
jgi:acetolactate synthase-1/2/3 large subunit